MDISRILRKIIKKSRGHKSHKEDDQYNKNSHAELNPRHAELRERRLQADKMLQWSILSESPSSYAAKGVSIKFGMTIILRNGT